MRRLVTAAACLLAALAGSRATRAAEGAAPPARVDVAVVRAPADDRLLVEATARLGLELGASGLSSAVVDLAGDGAPARVAFVREDGVATIDLVGTRPDATQLHRRVRVSPGDGGDDPAVLALRAAELLRGIRIEVQRPAPPPPARGPLDDTAPGPAPSPPPREILRLSAGAGVLEGSGGFRPVALAPALSVGAQVVRHVSVVVAAAGPFFSDLDPTPSGSAHIRQELGLFGLALDAAWPRLRLHLLLGSGVHHLRAEFDSRGIQGTLPPSEVRIRARPSAWTPLIAAGAGVSGRLWRWLGASFEVTALVLSPTLNVTVDGRSVGKMGGPSLLETAALWVAFP